MVGWSEILILDRRAESTTKVNQGHQKTKITHTHTKTNRTLSCPQIIILTSKYHYTITNNFLDINIFKLSQRVVKSPVDFFFFFKHLLTTRQTICASHFQEEHPASIQRHDGEKKKEKKVSTSQQPNYLSITLAKREASKRNSTQPPNRGMQQKLDTAFIHRHAREMQQTTGPPHS